MQRLHARTLPLSWVSAAILLSCLLASGSPAAEPKPTSPTAMDLAERAGIQGGLAVHLARGDAQWIAALAADARFLIHGLRADPLDVARCREQLDSLGLVGRVSFDRFDGQHLPYKDNLVRLLMVGDGLQVSDTEVLRVLCPGGVAFKQQGVKWTQTAKPWPTNIDSWTHYLHDSSNNAVSADSVVGPPRGFQWIARPRWARSHDHLASLSAMVSANGRLFSIIDEAPVASVAIPPQWSLVARDAFSGVLLWKRPIASWEGHLRGFRSGPTELARRLVAVGDQVFVTLGYGEPVSRLDAVTGTTLQTYAGTENALEIVCHQATLYVVAGDRVPDNVDNASVPQDPERVWHWWPVFDETPPRKHLLAVPVDSGKVLWEIRDPSTRELLPTTLAAAGERIFFQNPEAIVALEAASGSVLWTAPRPLNRQRPTWSTPTLVVQDNVLLSGDRAIASPLPDVEPSDQPTRWSVNSHGGVAPAGHLQAYAADSGDLLWEAECREGYNAPVDVLVADGLVWSGDLVSRRDPGITVARDLETGRVLRERPADQDFFPIVMGHHRCYRNKATDRFLVLGRDGIELIDLDSGEGFGHAWVRGTCQYGVMPCNGLIYSPQHSCACHVESKLNGFLALAPLSSMPSVETTRQSRPEARLQQGPAFGETGETAAPEASPDIWPTYRHDAARSGCVASPLPDSLEPAWETKLDDGRLGSPVVTEDQVFLPAIDAHRLVALDLASGQVLWKFTAGGRIDSPPTIHGPTAIFGSADGWIYCVRTTDGQLVWRFRAAPEDRRIVVHDQLESVWPLHGSVLVQNGTVFAVSGRTGHLDGGMLLVRLEAASGELRSETPLTDAALPDVLSSDGTSVFLRHRRFDLQGQPQPADVPHLYSPAGFLDDSWWHRTYWLFGTQMRSGWGSWPNVGTQVPAGRLLALNTDRVYGFGRFDQYHRDGSHVGMGNTRYLLYAAARPGDASTGPSRRVSAIWAKTVPLMARAMLAGPAQVLVAGPPDTFAYPEQTIHAYRITSIASAREQQAAFEGQRGGWLMSFATADGRERLKRELTSPPVWDGLAAAGGRVVMCCMDGRVICLTGRP